MYSFQNYKKLNDDVAEIATNFWVLEIKSRLGCRSLYQLPIELAQLGSTLLDGSNEQISKYWNKKFNGKRLRNDVKVKKIESIPKLLGCSQMLFHPLWMLLNKEKHSNSELLEIARNLPLSISNRILGEKNGKPYLKELRKEIAFENTLDALTAKLIYLLRDKNNYPTMGDNPESVETFKLFLRLFSLRYRCKYDGRLYQLISRYFSQSEDVVQPFSLPNSEQTISNFPLNFGHTLTEKEAHAVINTYRKVMRVTSMNVGIHNLHRQMSFFSYVSYRYLGMLLNEINDLKRNAKFEGIPLIAVSIELFKQNKKRIEKIHDLDYDYFKRWTAPF